MIITFCILVKHVWNVLFEILYRITVMLSGNLLKKKIIENTSTQKKCIVKKLQKNTNTKKSHACAGYIIYQLYTWEIVCRRDLMLAND